MVGGEVRSLYPHINQELDADFPQERDHVSGQGQFLERAERSWLSGSTFPELGNKFFSPGGESWVAQCRGHGRHTYLIQLLTTEPLNKGHMAKCILVYNQDKLRGDFK